MALTVGDLIELLERYKVTHAGGANDQVLLKDPNPFALANHISFSSDVRWNTSLETGVRSLILSTDTPEPAGPATFSVDEMFGELQENKLDEEGWPADQNRYPLYEVTVPLLIGKTLDNTTFVERELPVGTQFLATTFLDAKQNDRTDDDESYLIIRVQHEFAEYQAKLTDFQDHAALIREAQ